MGLLTAHFCIVALTVLLVVMNVHVTVVQYLKDLNLWRLSSYIGTLIVAGSLILTISFMVVDRVLDSELSLRELPQHQGIRTY